MRLLVPLCTLLFVKFFYFLYYPLAVFDFLFKTTFSFFSPLFYWTVLAFLCTPSFSCFAPPFIFLFLGIILCTTHTFTFALLTFFLFFYVWARPHFSFYTHAFTTYSSTSFILLLGFCFLHPTNFNFFAPPVLLLCFGKFLLHPTILLMPINFGND